MGSDSAASNDLEPFSATESLKGVNGNQNPGIVVSEKSMSKLKEYSDKIGEEVTAVLSRVDLEQMKTFLDLIQGARKIALYGGGREGLMIRALAMRLFHLGALNRFPCRQKIQEHFGKSVRNRSHSRL